MQEIILKIRYFERGLSKSFNPDPLNRQSYQKQKGSGACDQALFRLQNKLQKFLCYILLV